MSRIVGPSCPPHALTWRDAIIEQQGAWNQLIRPVDHVESEDGSRGVFHDKPVIVVFKDGGGRKFLPGQYVTLAPEPRYSEDA